MQPLGLWSSTSSRQALRTSDAVNGAEESDRALPVVVPVNVTGMELIDKPHAVQFSGSVKTGGYSTQVRRQSLNTPEDQKRRMRTCAEPFERTEDQQ